jgi:hypothetical protein
VPSSGKPASPVDRRLAQGDRIPPDRQLPSFVAGGYGAGVPWWWPMPSWDNAAALTQATCPASASLFRLHAPWERAGMRAVYVFVCMRQACNSLAVDETPGAGTLLAPAVQVLAPPCTALMHRKRLL